MTATPVLEMRHIAKAFGKFYALKGVDLGSVRHVHRQKLRRR